MDLDKIEKSLNIMKLEETKMQTSQDGFAPDDSGLALENFEKEMNEIQTDNKLKIQVPVSKME